MPEFDNLCTFWREVSARGLVPSGWTQSHSKLPRVLYNTPVVAHQYIADGHPRMLFILALGKGPHTLLCTLFQGGVLDHKLYFLASTGSRDLHITQKAQKERDKS